MPEVSLTQFVDFVIIAGTPKLTKVREIKNQDAYNPATDFWKPLRDEIRRQPNGRNLDQLLESLGDGKKMRRYPSAVKGYKKFIGRKEFQWFAPSSSEWTYRDLVVRVNPEIGFEAGGVRNLVKLYFKDEKPSKRRLDVVFEMMKETLSSKPGSATMAVLDVNNGRLVRANAQSLGIGPLLRAEAAAFMEIWNSI